MTTSESEPEYAVKVLSLKVNGSKSLCSISGSSYSFSKIVILFKFTFCGSYMVTTSSTVPEIAVSSFIVVASTASPRIIPFADTDAFVTVDVSFAE